jgi:apoptosis-inducing factor 3
MGSSDKPDLTKGILQARLADGHVVLGRVGDDEAILTRRGSEYFAVGARCTHYGGPLAEGLIIGDEVRCPWHHACFSLRTGEALRAPALDAVPCWRVEQAGDKVFVRERLVSTARRTTSVAIARSPASVVIVGGGAAGLSAAHTLRAEGYDGPVTILSADASPPCDRPNLSKDYLAGHAQEEWIPLRSPDYYRDQDIELLLNTRVSSLDAPGKRLQLSTGAPRDFDHLLLATGADPVQLAIPGAGDSRVCYLRTYADSRDLVEKAARSKHVVIIGSSFIGLEVAGSLRERGLAVRVLGRDRQPLERVLGPEVGRFLRELHEAHGVVFHLGDSVTRVEGDKVLLASGTILEADLLVVGIGVQPSIALAERASLRVDRGVLVNEYLETSAPGIFAAGDIARWPDAYSGSLVRIEHWVVAERQGQVAARNMLGGRERFEAVPFFWTRQHDVSISYVGHAETWDAIDIHGSLDAKDCAVSYRKAGRTLAVATIGRDLESLKAEAALEKAIRAQSSTLSHKGGS